MKLENGQAEVENVVSTLKSPVQQSKGHTSQKDPPNKDYTKGDYVHSLHSRTEEVVILIRVSRNDLYSEPSLGSRTNRRLSSQVLSLFSPDSGRSLSVSMKVLRTLLWFKRLVIDDGRFIRRNSL